MKTLKDIFEVYRPKSPDEQKFVDKHVTIKHKDRNGNDDDVFKGNTKYIKRKEERHGYDVNDDEKVYEEVEDVEEARIWQGDYTATSEKSQFGGHRPKVVHKEKGHTMYLGQHAYKKPEMARKHAEAYLSAYSQRGDTAGQNASIDFARANKKHLYVKEDIDAIADDLLDEALDLLMSIDEKTLTPAEMKKREEVVKAIKRGNPKMDKSMAYAIATKTAKRVAEESEELDEARPVGNPEYDESEKMWNARKAAWEKEQKKKNKPTNESTDAYGKSIDDIKKKSITSSDKDKLARLHAMMSAEKKPVKEEAEDLDEGLMHDRYLRSHGKKARGTGSWAFTTKQYGEPNKNEMHFTSGQKSLSDAHKEAAAKLGTKHLYVMEAVDQIDELSKKTLGAYGSKALRAGLSGDEKSEKRMKGANLASAKMYPDQYKKSPLRAKVPANEEVEELDELSVKKLTDYTAAASDARRHRGASTAKLDNRYKGVMRAGDKINKGFTKVHATEEVEELDELSRKTLGNYAYKATNQVGEKGITAGLKIQNNEPAGKELKTMGKRQRGVAMAVKKLTKEDIINRAIDSYLPDDYVLPSLEERFLERIDSLSEGHAVTLLQLFNSLSEENQLVMLNTVMTSEGINELLNFAIENRGE